MKVNNELYEDIKLYCELNEIKDVDKFINDLLKKAFMVEKYGDRPVIPEKTELPPEPVFEEPTEDVKEEIPQYKIEIKNEEQPKTDKDIYGE